SVVGENLQRRSEVRIVAADGDRGLVPGALDRRIEPGGAKGNRTAAGLTSRKAFEYRAPRASGGKDRDDKECGEAQRCVTRAQVQNLV
ncbi:MAG: hypothetical protein IT175_09650, partial [Acidobacteria bacterium]|nr:hypothetical protein [Acidobacteriota bacterium]